MNPVHAHHTSILWVGGRLVGSLLLVVVLFLGAVWLLRFLQKKTLSGGSSSKKEAISVRTTIALAPKTTLSVISVGEESFLIGVTPQSVSLLSRLSNGREEVRIAGESLVSSSGRSSFASPGADPSGDPTERLNQERMPNRYGSGSSPAQTEQKKSSQPGQTNPIVQTADQEENFEDIVQGALEKIRKGRQDREVSSSPSRRWSV